MRILWITPKWTLPVTDGARVATDSLIRNIVYCGASVDYWALTNEDDRPDPEQMKAVWGVEKADYTPRSLPLKSLRKKIYYLKKLITSPLKPLTFSSFSDKRFTQELDIKLKTSNYDFIVLDGLHLGVLVDNLPARILAKVIYRAHNIEADLWRKSYLSSKNPFIKTLFWMQYLLVKRFEEQLISKVGGVAAISQEDFDVIKNFNSSLTLTPLGLKFPAISTPAVKESTEYIFVGRLDWPPNRDGLKWLLDEVWPEVARKRPDVRFSVYGSGNSQWLQEYQDVPQLNIVGFIPAIADAYRDAHFTLVPVFYGSGTRIKVIESFSFARRLVSTEMGVQGANLNRTDYFNVETKDEWIKLLSQLQFIEEDFEKLLESRKRISNEFDEVKIAERFYSWLKER